eukprot:577798-Pleurochrysis_carterae.AAC.3
MTREQIRRLKGALGVRDKCLRVGRDWCARLAWQASARARNASVWNQETHSCALQNEASKCLVLAHREITASAQHAAFSTALQTVHDEQWANRVCRL